jgi:hypothetical protein
VVVVAAVVGVVVAIRSARPAPVPATATAAAASAPAAIAPASASPSPPAPGASSPAPAPAVGVGPSTVVGGVPMGYAHSPAGAEAAGVAFLRLDGSLVAMSDEAASAAKRVIASSSAADGLVADVVAKLDALRKGYPGGTTLYRIGVLATRVSPAGPDRVRVELWHVGVVSPPAALPYEDWATQRYELVWERNDWRDAGEASTPGPRPLPQPQVNPSGPGQLEAALAGFGPLGTSR